MTVLQIGRTQLDGDTVLLSVKGDLDAFSVGQFRQATAPSCESSTLLIELDSKFIDSAGLNVLVQAVRRARDQQGEAVVICTKWVSDMLTFAGFDRLATLSSSLEAARTALGASSSVMPVTKSVFLDRTTEASE